MHTSSVIVHPASVNGTLQIPASKSATQRACAAALLLKGKTTLYNMGISNDEKAALQIIQHLGATATVSNHKIEIDSTLVDFDQVFKKPLDISCGESGLSLRMFSPIAALNQTPVVVEAEGSLRQRPIEVFTKTLPQLGIKATATNNGFPLLLEGPLQLNNITVDGSISSQFLTGLLMSYSAKGQYTKDFQQATITVDNLKSKPYIDLTLHIMQHFGMLMPKNNNYETFVFSTSQKALPAEVTYSVEADWSSASFIVVAAAIAGSVHIKGLLNDSTQADKAIMQAVMDAGAIVSYANDGITVSKPTKPLQAFSFDATECPDLFPPLVALASYCQGPTTIQGVNRLQFKESNRGLTLQQEFKKLGVDIVLDDDIMIVRPSKDINGAVCSSCNDHRIAMACAVAALKATSPITITNAYAINKSYPQFYQHLQQLGATVTEA